MPDYKIKTPLQRSIQILKRHRDVLFNKDDRSKPKSIIITTLSALSYQNESSILESLLNILDKMTNYIENREGVTWVPNPVNPLENFAEKWQENPEYETIFRDWLQRAKADINKALQQYRVLNMSEVLKDALGEREISEALKNFSIGIKNIYLSGNVIPRDPFDVPHKELFQNKWSVLMRYSVSISCYYELNNRKYYYKSDSRPLPKSLTLFFEAETDVPPPFEIYWQVVNTGEEAAQNNDLRGTIERGTLDHREYTKYTGMHWIECFIVKEGTCLARSKEYVINIA